MVEPDVGLFVHVLRARGIGLFEMELLDGSGGVGGSIIVIGAWLGDGEGGF